MSVNIRQLNLKTQIEGFLEFAREKGSNEPAQMALELALSKLTENEKEAFFSGLEAIATNPDDAAQIAGQIPLSILVVSPELREIKKCITDECAFAC